MATTEKLTFFSTQTQLVPSGSTGSLANNANYVAGAFNNAQGTTNLDGYPYGRLTFNGSFGAAVSSNSSINVWFLTSEDGGVTYEDSSVTPVRAPDAIIPLDTTNTFQQKTMDCDVPVSYFKPLIQNAGTGQTLASGWSLYLMPWTPQGV